MEPFRLLRTIIYVQATKKKFQKLEPMARFAGAPGVSTSLLPSPVAAIDCESGIIYRMQKALTGFRAG